MNFNCIMIDSKGCGNWLFSRKVEICLCVLYAECRQSTLKIVFGKIYLNLMIIKGPHWAKNHLNFPIIINPITFVILHWSNFLNTYYLGQARNNFVFFSQRMYVYHGCFYNFCLKFFDSTSLLKSILNKNLIFGLITFLPFKSI